MSRGDGVHYSKQEQRKIIADEGINVVQADELACIFESYSFIMFDALYQAIGKIKKGA